MFRRTLARNKRCTNCVYDVKVKLFLYLYERYQEESVSKLSIMMQNERRDFIAHRTIVSLCWRGYFWSWALFMMRFCCSWLTLSGFCSFSLISSLISSKELLISVIFIAFALWMQIVHFLYHRIPGSPYFCTTLEMEGCLQEFQNC